jgi:hypothetical protein
MNSESIKFLLDYFEQSLAENDLFSVAWVAIQINLPEDSSPEQIRSKLKAVLAASVAGSRYGV